MEVVVFGQWAHHQLPFQTPLQDTIVSITTTVMEVTIIKSADLCQP